MRLLNLVAQALLDRVLKLIDGIDPAMLHRGIGGVVAADARYGVARLDRIIALGDASDGHRSCRAKGNERDVAIEIKGNDAAGNVGGRRGAEDVDLDLALALR